jgi:RNA polymerase sigma-70 factor (ECF subfamily)
VGALVIATEPDAEHAGHAAELALVAAARGGDRGAFGRLAERYAAPLAAFAARRVARGHEAEDVAQATLLRALAAIGELREPERFRGWLYGIALNECRRRHRGLERLRRAYERWRERRSGVVPAPASEDGETARVRAALDKLPERQRLAVELRIWDGLSCDEAATALGVTTGTIKANFHHAIEKLRADLRRGERGP